MADPLRQLLGQKRANIRDVIQKWKEDDWVQVRQESSHRSYKKDGVPYVITVPGQDRDEVSPGVLSDTRRKTGLPLR